MKTKRMENNERRMANPSQPLFIKGRGRGIIALLLLVTGFLLLVTPALWAGGPGTSGAQFLKMGTGARPIGMGESFVAVADDANAVLWNPGGLCFLKQKEFTAMHNEYLEEIRMSGFSYVHPSKDWGTFAGNILYLYANDIERTVINSDVPEGYERRGTFGVSDKSLMLSYGKLIFGGKDYSRRSLGFGMGIRYIEETLDSYRATAYAFDFGALYKYNHRLRMGFALQNLGTKMRFVREKESLPLVMRAGIGRSGFNGKLNYSFEAWVPQDSGLEIHGGGEFWIYRIIAPRIGYRFRKLQRDNDLGMISGISGGIGFRFFNYQIDYAIVPFGEVGNTHKISLTGRF